MSLSRQVQKRSAYLYGITDIKANKALQPKQNVQVKKQPLDTYKFSVHEKLLGKEKRKLSETPFRFHYTPETLVELAGYVVDKTPLPNAFNWTGMDVIDWIEKLGYPEYRNTFHRNFINGHTLIFLNASILSAMNITKFGHIKAIIKSINKLYGLNMIRFIRSISLPPRYPFTHFNFYHGQTGPKYHNTIPTNLFRKMQMLRLPPSYNEHWQRLVKWLKHIRPIDTERFGLSKRNNLYAVKKNPINIFNYHKKLIPRDIVDAEDIFNMFLTEKDCKKPWLMRYLIENDSPAAHRDHFKNIDFNNCNCEMICECLWTRTQYLTEARTVKALRQKFFKKYEVIESQYVDVIDVPQRKHSTATATVSFIVNKKTKKSILLIK